MNSNRHISSFSIILTFVCLALVGLVLIPRLTVKLAPSRSLPQIHVHFSMPGSSSRIVEMEATSRLEAMLNRLSGLKKINSSSGNGWGYIYLEFDRHTNMEMARFEVSTIIRQTWPMLPQQVSYPEISLSRVDNHANTPFLSYTINAPASPLLIQQFVENQLKTRLSQMEGIYRVQVRGASPVEWQLMYDYKQLENTGITIREIRTAISQHLNKDFLGIVSIQDEKGDKQWIRIALTSDIQDDSSFENISILNKEGKLVALSQLVEINKVESSPQSYYRINGLNSIYLSLFADENANQLQLSKKVRDELKNPEYLLPDGYEVHLAYDATEYIHEELTKIYFRAGLTLFILLFFILLVYRDFRYTLLILISLFINLLVAIILYYLFHLEIQLYSLAGITISLTLIIDNTIVMLDQIIRRNNMQAYMAILAATLTSIASLSIIFFLEEKLRLSFRDFALVLMFNLFVSLFIALFLVPALVEKMNIKKRDRKKKHPQPESKKRKKFSSKRPVIRFNKIYAGLCIFMRRWRVLFILFLILAFGFPVFLLPEKIEDDTKWAGFYNRTLGSDYFKDIIKPYTDKIFGGTIRLFVEHVYDGSYFADRQETSLLVTATLPSYSTLEQMNHLIQRMESYLSRFPEIKQFQTNIYSARQANIEIRFTKDHQKSNFPHLLKAQLIERSLELGGGSWGVFGLGDGFSNDVRENAGSYRVEMYGFNYDELLVWAQHFKNKLLSHRRIREVSINSEFSWYKDDYEEFSFVIDKEQLIRENLQPYQLYQSLENVFGKDLYAGQLPGESSIEKIYLSSGQAGKYDLWNLNYIPLKIGEREYKLSELAVIEKEQAPQNVAKVNQEYRLCLQYEYIGSTEQGRKVLEHAVTEFEKELPVGYIIKDVGFDYWTAGKGKKEYYLLFLIFIIIYFITSILFNSLKQPLFIIFIIPISFIGIFLTFYFFHLNFDQGGFVSFILLSALTINANIYIIDEYNNIKKQSKIRSPLKIYIKAWNAKVRPIFLTIVSTVLGFIPFLIGTDKEAFWFPLAAGTIGGLMLSFMATFLFLPLFMGIGKIEKKK
ncbi:MAG: efflux RND transporter permease subunit [Candidatus Azobacteroides sp.]|nr:efflux RND transporter permease subunit [Candidatus Azobacteroides sp.]